MSQQSPHPLQLPVLVRMAPAPEPGFWARFGASLAEAGRCVGRGIAAGFHSVDPDVRRELASLPLMALSAVGPRTDRIAAKRDDGCRPVVFVHGLAGHKGNFRPMSAFFHTQGRRRLYGVSLPPRDTTKGHAEHLSRMIERVLEANEMPEGQVDLVAHSRGGIVARLALNDVLTARRVARLVTVGTPHGGTVTARYARGRHLDELRPDSPVIAQLARQLPWTGPPMVCLYSREDPLVAPAEHAQVPGATSVELEGLSHCQLLLWPAGWRAALAAVS